MKSKLLILFLLPIFTIFGEKKEELNGYMYLFIENPMNLNLTNGVFTPFLGIGGRQVTDKNGIDYCFSAEPYMIAKSKTTILSFQANINYLRFYYDKYYSGIGGNILGIHARKYFYILKSPVFIMGRHFMEKDRKYFIQLKISWPNFPAIWVKDYPIKFNREERNKRMWVGNFFITTGICF